LDKNAVNPVQFANRLKTSEDVTIIVVAVPDMKGHTEKEALEKIASSGEFFELKESINNLVDPDFVGKIKHQACGRLPRK
jgi:hypothetical protein